ncbi:MAG TPA: pilus assembly protein PilP [Thermoanaerobaculia bacterium]|nr:pilus assembly protein PilP [Thermoanaerobaculia bacterium]
MDRARTLLAAGVVFVFCAFSAAAQTADQPAAEPATSSIEENLQEILEDPVGDDTYQYDSQGRRDPFRSLVGPTRTLDRGNRPPGVPGFMIDELDIQGVVQTRAGMVAMIKGPDNKGYLIRTGEKLFDGEVTRIDRTAVVFRQEVNDPTRIERFREVIKELVRDTGQNRR